MNDTKLRYSEAIRLGSLLVPQAFGESGLPGRACANAAAGLAVGQPGAFTISLFPIGDVFVACPVCGQFDALVAIVAECLNDTHRWTREAIADFVATFESESSPSEAAETVELAEVAQLAEI